MTYAIIAVVAVIVIGFGLFAINQEPAKRHGARGGLMVGQVNDKSSSH